MASRRRRSPGRRGKSKNKTNASSSGGAAPPPPLAPPGDFRKYAIYIAVNDYSRWRAGGDYGDLEGCVNDAEAVRAVLEANHNYTTLGALYNAEATQANIIDLFERIARVDPAVRQHALQKREASRQNVRVPRCTELDQGVQLQACDQLLIYIAGHGEGAGRGFVCFDKGKRIPFVETPASPWATGQKQQQEEGAVPCPHCHHKYPTASALAVHKLHSHASLPFFAKLFPSKHQLFVVDACHAGALVRHHAETRLKPRSDFGTKPAFHCALSVTEDECAVEKMDPNGNMRGVFSWHFLRAIDTSGVVPQQDLAFREHLDRCTASAVIYKVREKVFAHADEAHADQNVCFGSLVQQENEAGQFMFYRAAVAPKVANSAANSAASGGARKRGGGERRGAPTSPSTRESTSPSTAGPSAGIQRTRGFSGVRMLEDVGTRDDFEDLVTDPASTWSKSELWISASLLELWEEIGQFRCEHLLKTLYDSKEPVNEMALCSVAVLELEQLYAFIRHNPRYAPHFFFRTRSIALSDMTRAFLRKRGKTPSFWEPSKTRSEAWKAMRRKLRELKFEKGRRGFYVLVDALFVSEESLPAFVLCNMLSWEMGELYTVAQEYTTLFRWSGKKVSMTSECRHFLEDCGERPVVKDLISGSSNSSSNRAKVREKCKIHARCRRGCKLDEKGSRRIRRGRKEEEIDDEEGGAEGAYLKIHGDGDGDDGNSNAASHFTTDTDTPLEIRASTLQGNVVLSAYCRTFHDKPFGKKFHKRYAEGRQKAGGRLTKRSTASLWKDPPPHQSGSGRCPISRTCVLPEGHARRCCASLTSPQFPVFVAPIVTGGGFLKSSRWSTRNLGLDLPIPPPPPRPPPPPGGQFRTSGSNKLMFRSTFLDSL
jgi:hypothetical protein